MTKNAGKDATRRTQVKDMPRPERELSAEEQKSVMGGATRIIPGGVRSNAANLGTGGEPETNGFRTLSEGD